MPPSQPFVTSRIRGFVCGSCLSQLRKPRRPRTPWLVRNVASGRPSRITAPKGKKKNADPIIRYFDQTPDGIRRELEEDTEEQAMLKDVEEQIRMFEEPHLEQEEFDPESLVQQGLKEYDISESMKASMEEIKAQMENVSDLENLSEEERTKLRSRLLNLDTEGMWLPSS
jgi:hypothetical protein